MQAQKHSFIFFTGVILLCFLSVDCSGPQQFAASAQASRQQIQSAAIFTQFTYQGLDEVFAQPPEPGYFQNPIIAGFYPDPSITRAGDSYYLATSSFGFTPGIPIFKSDDLVHWQQLGYALNNKPFLTLEGQDISRGIYAPTLRFHQGMFYLITTAVEAGGNFLITAQDPSGPWSDPIWLPEVGGIDPDIFFDDTGKVYITHNDGPPGEPRYNGHRAIWMWEFDLTKKKVIPGSKKLLVDGGADISQKPIWIEAPHIFKNNGWYYLICAEGGTGSSHSEVVFRTRDINTAFTPFEDNPILTQRDLDPNRNNPITSAGHADIIQTANGDWWAVFLATRAYDQKYYHTGRETFLLPVTWKNDWPIILEKSATIPYQLAAPKTDKKSAVKKPLKPLTGNFSVTDYFNSHALDLSWNRLRDNTEEFLSIDNGHLKLHPKNTLLSDLSQPAFIGRRVQHTHFIATTTLLAPTNKGTEAGLAAFQNARFHYFFGVKKIEHKRYRLFIEKVSAGSRSTVTTKNIHITPNQPLLLHAEINAGDLDFYFQQAKHSPKIKFGETQDAKILSTEVAGGFVGAYIGLHARATLKDE